jgi:predicted ester cyclase
VADDNEQLVLRLEAAIEVGDLVTMQALCGPDLVDHNPFPGQVAGGRGFLQKADAMRLAFPDLRRLIDFTVVEGDLVVTRWTLSATHAEPFLGVAATGNHVSVTGISIYRFEARRVVEHWSELDGISLLAQLGAFPLAEPPPDAPALLA